MHVHSDIAALRFDREPQRQAQEGILQARERFRQEPEAEAMLSDLESYGEGADLADCPVLQKVFTGSGEAERLLHLLSHHYCRSIRDNPYGHPPFRHGFDGKSSSILLARSGRAQLMLQAREPGQVETAGYVFADATRLDAVVAGTARARRVRVATESADTAVFAEDRLKLRSGTRLALDLRSEALVLEDVSRRLVVLRLLRGAAVPEPSREYCARTGALVHRSSGLIASSRKEAIIALLGRMKRTDAAPQMAALALGKGEESLRWQALRECLALDTRAGFAALIRLARRAEDPLAAPAGALRAQLLETHPALAKLESETCPA